MAVASLFEDLLDQYKIEQRIAEKQYTDLFQAYDVDDDRQVRIDILRAPYAEDSSFAGRFVNRARAMAQVRHSNIAQVLHIGKAADGAPYVAQTAVNGYSLSYRLEQLAKRNTPVNPIYALKLIRQLADALLLAERLELFHHDLQPDNVLLKNVTLPTDDSVVLIDLFIPWERENRGKPASSPSTGEGYLSPEQRSGKEVTAASHIYSLGAMLFRLLAGRMPDHPVTKQDVVLGRIFGRASALQRERADLTPATYNLVERSLRKDSRGRFSDIEAFTAALDGALAAEEIRLSTASGPPPAVDRRSLAWLLPLLIVALFLTVGAVATHSLVNREVEVTTPAPASAAGGPTSPAVALQQDGVTEVPALSPTAAVGAMATEESGAGSTVEAGSTSAAGPTNDAVDAGPTATKEPTPMATPTEAFTPTAIAESTVEVPQVRVIFNLVNLRRGPGVNYSLAGNVSAGETLEVLAKNDDEENPWYLILTGDQRIAWIAATVVQVIEPDALAEIPVAATLPPTPVPTFTPTPTPTLIMVMTTLPTATPGEPGGEVPTNPPIEPTDTPTEPTIEPTRTPPPLPSPDGN